MVETTGRTSVPNSKLSIPPGCWCKMWFMLDLNVWLQLQVCDFLVLNLIMITSVITFRHMLIRCAMRVPNLFLRNFLKTTIFHICHCVVTTTKYSVQSGRNYIWFTSKIMTLLYIRPKICVLQEIKQNKQQSLNKQVWYMCIAVKWHKGLELTLSIIFCT